MKVVRYNKYLQKIIDRRLIHYKIFSERYIIHGQDGKGKEYNCYNELEFQGEYLNGKRNGKGKEYSKGNIIFEGEYLNGYRWNGKSKKYNLEHELESEVEYLNGEIKQ